MPDRYSSAFTVTLPDLQAWRVGVQLSAELPPDANKVLAFVKQRLPDFQKPARVLFALSLTVYRSALSKRKALTRNL